MSTTHAKYQTFAVPDDRQVLRTAARPGLVSLLVASLLVAIPLPAFAESALSKNIAIALSSNIVGSQAGQGVIRHCFRGDCRLFRERDWSYRRRFSGHGLCDHRQSSRSSVPVCR